jgi:hypothetical protein
VGVHGSPWRGSVGVPSRKRVTPCALNIEHGSEPYTLNPKLTVAGSWGHRRSRALRGLSREEREHLRDTPLLIPTSSPGPAPLIYGSLVPRSLGQPYGRCMLIPTGSPWFIPTRERPLIKPTGCAVSDGETRAAGEHLWTRPLLTPTGYEVFCFFFITLDRGPSRPLSLESSDPKVYEP